MKLFKKLNKGFTLVELVVVIAVIAILSAVSVVAYTGITKNAKKTTAMSNARSAYDAWLTTDEAEAMAEKNLDILSGDYWFHVANGQFNSTANDTDPGDSANYTIATGDNAEKGLVAYSAPAPANP